jgi:hypothetical protein
MNIKQKIAFIGSYDYMVYINKKGYLVIDPLDDQDGWIVQGPECVLDETIEMINSRKK